MKSSYKRWTAEEDAIIAEIKADDVRRTLFEKVNGAKRALKERSVGAITQRMYKVKTLKSVPTKGVKNILRVELAKDHIKLFF